MLLNCTFTTTNDNSNVGYIDIRHKAPLFESDVVFSVENPMLNPTSSVITSSLTLSLKKSDLPFVIGSANSSGWGWVTYGQEKSLLFGLKLPQTSQQLLPLFPARISCKISLDTTGLENIQVLMPTSEERLTPDSVTVSGSIMNLHCTFPMSVSSIGRVRFRSKSLVQRDNAFSIIGKSAPPGFRDIPSQFTFRQTGVSGLELDSNQLVQLEQGQNIINYIAPNPAADNLIIQYIVATPAENITVELMNTLGATVLSAALPKQSYGIYDLPLDLKGIPAGMYLLRVRSNTNTETHRVMISR